MIEHATAAQAIIGIAGLGVGTSIGVVLAGMLRSGAVADLYDTIAARDLTADALRARIRELEPLADEGRKTLAQRQKALDAARAANAARAALKADNVAPIKKRA